LERQGYAFQAAKICFKAHFTQMSAYMETANPRVDGIIARHVPAPRIAVGAALMVLQCRMHDLMSQDAGQLRCIQRVYKVGV
jgi:NADH:ubiquinone oxidoreductase subunit K